MSAVIVIINTVHPAGVLPACNAAQFRSFPNTHQLPFSPLASSRRRPHPDNLPLLETALLIRHSYLFLHWWRAFSLTGSQDLRLSSLVLLISFPLFLSEPQSLSSTPRPLQEPILNPRITPLSGTHTTNGAPQTHTHVQTSAKTVTVLEGFP